jgi:hypothetical protein
MSQHGIHYPQSSALNANDVRARIGSLQAIRKNMIDNANKYVYETNQSVAALDRVIEHEMAALNALLNNVHGRPASDPQTPFSPTKTPVKTKEEQDKDDQRVAEEMLKAAEATPPAPNGTP